MPKKLFLFLLLFPFVLKASGQKSIYFLNKSGWKILVQQRTITEYGYYPYTLETDKEQYQAIPASFSSPAILNIIAMPPKGPYGTADGLYFLLQPGDSISITLTAANKPQLSHTSNPVRTKELDFFQSHIASLKKLLPYTLYGMNGNIALTKRIWGADLKMRDQVLDSLYQPYITSAGSFAASNGYDPAIGQWFRYFYLGSLYSDKLFTGRKLDDQFKQALQTFYKDSLAKWNGILSCENCENIPPYNHALQKITEMRFNPLNEHAYLNNIAMNNKGSNKNFLLSRYVLDRLELTGNRQKLLEQYDRLCDDSIYKHTVHDNYKRYSEQTRGPKDEMAVLMKADKSKIGFKQLLSGLKGHVVYIDFWASWCKPCIEEFVYSDSLREKVKGKNITMLFFSVDSDADKWLKATNRYKMSDTHSFLLLDSEKNKLAQQINLGPIPRYLIIDKKGQIVRLEATRPSDPETFNTLIELVNKD